MILEALTASVLRIPFRATFKHAAAERSVTQSLWVRAESADRTIGCGEGCPREYVTNEGLQSALSFVREQTTRWLAAIRDFGTLRDWLIAHRRDVDRNAAAWTAVELALLDLLGKEQGQSVERLLGLPEISGEFSYTAIIGDVPPAAFEAQLANYTAAGFATFKIKLASDRTRNLEKVRLLVAAGLSPAQVRADANNAWPDAQAALADLAALDYPFCALEEPLPAGDFDGMRELALGLDTKIILDESVTRMEHLAGPARLPERYIVNVRVSKMGGLVRSLEVVREMRRLGLPLIVGAHVGETSLLTRAALTIAASAHDLLVAQEGAFGTHLLAFDVVQSPIMFGAGGVLEAGANLFASTPGLGLDFDSGALQEAIER